MVKRPQPEKIPQPEGGVEHIAHWISRAGSPPSLALLGCLLVTLHQDAPRRWLWFGLYLGPALLLPMLFLLWQLKQGQITDVDIYFRHQRRESLLVTILGVALSWLALYWSGAPPSMLLLASMGVVQWIGILLVTLRWKISIHATTAAAVAVFLLAEFQSVAWPAALLVPLIAWSRVKLRRHTPAQVLAGITAGILSFLLAWELTSVLYHLGTGPY